MDRPGGSRVSMCMRNVATILVISITFAGVAEAKKKPLLPKPNVVLQSAKEAEAHGGYPHPIDWAKEMLVVVPGTGTQYFTLTRPSSSDKTSVTYSLMILDPNDPPCCGAPGCDTAWRERQKSKLPYEAGLLKIPRTTKRVYVRLSFISDTTPCKAP